MPLLVATRSRGKQQEFQLLLAALGRPIVFPDQLGLVESEEEEGVERFHTFLENATAKAEWFRERSGHDTLADDSGLEVDALHGAPGVASRRWSGVTGSEAAVSAANIAKLLRSLEGVPEPRRTARFRSVLVLANRAGPADGIVVEGTTEGRILDRPTGVHGFGYDPVFWSTELAASFGELLPAEKATVSHRARAVRALVERLGPVP